MVWSNLVSALTLLGPTLKQLAMEWPDELQLGAWVATMVALEVRPASCLSWPGACNLPPCSLPPCNSPRMVAKLQRGRLQRAGLQGMGWLDSGGFDEGACAGCPCPVPQHPCPLPSPPFPPGQSASFTAPRVIVRAGLGSLPALTDLRFRSTAKPLSFHAAGAGSPGRHAGGAPLLPAHLLKLKLEGCRLSEASKPVPLQALLGCRSGDGWSNLLGHTQPLPQGPGPKNFRPRPRTRPGSPALPLSLHADLPCSFPPR